MASSFWAPDRDVPSAFTEAHMGDILRQSLENNAFSGNGFSLYKEAAITQILFEQQNRLAPARTTEGSNEEYLQSLQRLRQNAVVQADDLTSHLRDLVNALGLSAERKEASEHREDPSAIEPQPSPAATLAHQVQPTVEQPQERSEAVPATTSSAPTSALAKLVAQAKAKQGSSAEQAPRATASGVGSKRQRDDASSPQQRVVSTASAHAAKDDGDDDEDEDDFAAPLAYVTAPVDRNLTAAGPSPPPSAADEAVAAVAKHPSQMTREEYLSQFKRAPRRGEIGQSTEEIARAEELGYVMSGSRSKAAQMYVDRIQRQLHEREASKLQQQFRKVEDERMDAGMITGMLDFIEAKKSS